MNRARTLHALLALLLAPAALRAQDRRADQTYLPGGFNWAFLRTYPEAGRLFNAFDYGHAILYERLLTQGAKAGAALARDRAYLVDDLLVRPPRLGTAEEAVAPRYTRFAWPAQRMFSWAHVLHRQIYDVYADDRIADSLKPALVERITDYYLSRPDVAFAAEPASMALMEGQPFSRVFRTAHPAFNGLIWSYHWMQVGLYEPLLTARTPAERRAGIDAAVAQFRRMAHDSTRSPSVMPMTPVIAPTFTARHPRAAAIFDNLHMAHDIISDILADERIPVARKREAIDRELARLRAGSHDLVSREEWLQMGEAMGGAAVMGGRVGQPVPDGPAPPHHNH